jgi:hypothetical protein
MGEVAGVPAHNARGADLRDDDRAILRANVYKVTVANAECVSQLGGYHDSSELIDSTRSGHDLDGIRKRFQLSVVRVSER